MPDDLFLEDNTCAIVSAYVANHQVAISDIEKVVTSVYNAVKSLGNEKPARSEPVDLKPAVPVKTSIQPDHIVCLEDGKKLKLLKRHLMSSYGMTPDEYRAKWNLPPDYPMVAPDHAKRRSEIALSIGFGQIGFTKKRAA